jgi:hypothetical protein
MAKGKCAQANERPELPPVANAQYGLKKLMEHIWTVVGMAAACRIMPELREKMAERYGKVPVQLTMYLDPPTKGAQLRRPYFGFSSPSSLSIFRCASRTAVFIE